MGLTSELITNTTQTAITTNAAEPSSNINKDPGKPDGEGMIFPGCDYTYSPRSCRTKSSTGIAATASSF